VLNSARLSLISALCSAAFVMPPNINSGLATQNSRIALGFNRKGMDVNKQWLRTIHYLLIAGRRPAIYQSRSRRLRLAPCADLDYGRRVCYKPGLVYGKLGLLCYKPGSF
jgi:hypothetical protein